MTAKCISPIMTNKDKFCIHTKDDSHDKFATAASVVRKLDCISASYIQTMHENHR